MDEPFIQRLSSSTSTKLRSTQILTSLPQVVSELFQNSLDAGAKHIEIGVNCSEWSCWVRDDGVGISKGSINILGTEGRYATSKAYSPDTLDCLSTFGFRGEALASAADMCCLEIASRTARSRETWSIILKDENILYTGPAVRWRRESQGTTVCVRDAFYNLPVRRRSHPSPSRTFELIRQEIESWAIIHHEVSFSLEDTEAKLAGSSKCNILKIPKTSSNLGAFRHLYGRALCEHVEEIDLTSGDMRLEGFISLEGALSKTYQFLYVNQHPMPSGELHRVIETKFTASSFAKNAFDEIGGIQRTCSSTFQLCICPSFLTQFIQLPGAPHARPKRNLFYVLNLVVPPHQIDNLLEPAKALLHFRNKTAVTEFLSSSVVSFLVRHGFTARGDAYQIQESPWKRQRVNCEHTSKHTEVRSDEAETANLPPIPLSLYAEKSHGTNELVWTDPSTGETFIVDAHTGNSRPQTQLRLAPEELDTNQKSQSLGQRRTLSLAGTTDKGPAPEWIQEALETNDSYAVSERKITEVTVESLGVHSCGSDKLHPQPKQYQQHQHFSRLFLSSQGDGDSNGHLHHRFAKGDIRGAQVISQVDRKFIACVFSNDLDNGDLREIQNDDSSTLVLIDQHAADERIRVERFLKDLCLGYLRSRSGEEAEGVEERHLTPPIPVLLTRHEASRLACSPDIQTSFQNWSIRFSGLAQIEALYTSTTGLDEEGDRYVQVSVLCVPEVVADKLTMGNELRDLIKGYLAQLEGDMPDINQGSPSDGAVAEGDWLKALRWCPRELLDLVNSKACRGAIMFNDSLTNEQCERLVCQLSETAFPFQCAHGRPSLVPLANLGKLSGNGGRTFRHSVRWSALDKESSLE